MCINTHSPISFDLRPECDCHHGNKKVKRNEYGGSHHSSWYTLQSLHDYHSVAVDLWLKNVSQQINT